METEKIDTDPVDYFAFFKNDRFAALAGAELIAVRPGYAQATLRVTEPLLNAGNVLQGGALFTLADLAMAAAANANGRMAFSIQSDIRFLQSGHLGDILTAEAHELLLRKTVCHYHVDITNQHGERIAVCDGICYRK